ncbi:hypothetical protein [Micromonospora sp. WMMD980]|uniref:hypothetical protein n=1 Tax=Micromonospora sp. WMMD980 TaxID=3016088 RepID=UPI002416E0E9|nr:hypothetical protein [Micromonospora sp. WMMD980]MDG4801748.1 hypothetical protein [Micromonospora sp. WMMD980]
MSAFNALWTVPAVRLTVAEEVAAIAAAKKGDSEAQLRLFTAYVPALNSAAAQYAALLSLDDARQTALLGFLEVIAAHDPEKSDRLAGKMRVRLHDAMTEAASDASNGFTVPARTLRRFFNVMKAANGDVAEAARIAPTFELATDRFYDVLAAVRADESLDLEVEINGGDAATTVVGEVTGPREIADAEDRVLVDLAFRAVNDFEADVCRLAYGFAEYDTVPDAEIGHRLGGFGRLKIQRTRTRALDKMRVALGA